MHDFLIESLLGRVSRLQGREENLREGLGYLKKLISFYILAVKSA